MRLRQLGPTAQRVEVVVPVDDMDLMKAKLKNYLGPDIADGDVLSVREVIQYALLNQASVPHGRLGDSR